MANLEYLKNVLLQFIFLRPGSERERLLPVIDTMLQLSPEEKGKLAVIAQGGSDKTSTTLQFRLNSWYGGLRTPLPCLLISHNTWTSNVVHWGSYHHMWHLWLNLKSRGFFWFLHAFSRLERLRKTDKWRQESFYPLDQTPHACGSQAWASHSLELGIQAGPLPWWQGPTASSASRDALQQEVGSVAEAPAPPGNMAVPSSDLKPVPSFHP